MGLGALAATSELTALRAVDSRACASAWDALAVVAAFTLLMVIVGETARADREQRALRLPSRPRRRM